jgi:hypothetical protein
VRDPSLALRRRTWCRDGYACRYCGCHVHPPVDGIYLRDDATVDHVIPRSLGGTNDPENLVTACRECNMAKSDTLGVRPKPIAARGEWAQLMSELYGEELLGDDAKLCCDLRQDEGVDVDLTSEIGVLRDRCR